MANDKYNIEIELKAQTEELRKVIIQLAEIKTSFSALREETTASSNIISGAFYNIGAQMSNLALKMPTLASSVIKAFGAEELAVQKLSTAIRENGGMVSEVLPVMRQFADDMQRITGYGNEQVLSMQAVASAMGVSGSRMQETIQNAIGLSTAFGIDLQTATKAASAAIQGKTELLTRYIPTLSSCKTEAEKLALVQQRARAGFAQAEEAAGTLDGRLKAAANAWSDLQKVIGGAVAPTVKTVAGLLQGVCEIFTGMPILTKTLTVSLSSLAVGFAFTKVGGLLKVADMFMGVASSVGKTTTAVRGLTAAVAANPLGLIAAAATAAIMGLTLLCENVSGLSEEEKKEEEAQEAARIARRKASEDTKRAAEIIDAYSESLKRSGETAEETAERIAALEAEIASLADQSKWSDGEQAAAAQKLVDKKRELAEAQKLYLERVNEAADAEYQSASIRETERKYRVEQELNAARKAGIKHIIDFKEAELAHVAELEKSVEIQKKYYADHKHLVNSEEDRIRIMADAEKYAKAAIDNLREERRLSADKAAAETWLSGEAEAAKTRQRGLEMDILRARASGNEAQAKELEGELHIAQLSREIFDNARKEGMSKQQLAALQNTAAQQARERYDLEKSITEEAERQNLAKNAQAKIEDIILQNKIEQLKSEGKITEAQELEREREIKRTLAGLGDAVSDADKKKLGNMMRQTNAYKDNPAAASPRGQAGGRAGFDGETAAALSRKNSLMSSGGGTLSAGDRQRGTPATVSAKNAGLYAEYQAAKKAGTATDGWNAFRDARQAAAPTIDKRGLQASARGFLQKTEDTARQLTSRNMPQKPAPAAKPAAASSALSNKLEQMGAQPKAQEGAQSEGETVSVLKEIKEEISAMHNDIKTQSTKKE